MYIHSSTDSYDDELRLLLQMFSSHSPKKVYISLLIVQMC